MVRSFSKSIDVEQRNWVFVTNYNFKIRISLQPYVLNLRYFKLRFFPYLVPLFELFLTKNKCLFRVFTKWLNLSRTFFFAKFCAIFAHETRWVLRNLRKTGNNFCESCTWNEILVLRNFFCVICAKCNFLGKLSIIYILSLELNNWRFIPYIKKILTYEYDNVYTTLNWLLPVTKSLN